MIDLPINPNGLGHEELEIAIKKLLPCCSHCLRVRGNRLLIEALQKPGTVTHEPLDQQKIITDMGVYYGGL